MKSYRIQTIKAGLIALICSFIFNSLGAQEIVTPPQKNAEELTVIGSQLFYNNKPIKLRMACNISLINKKLEAYQYFKKAQSMKGWNVAWSVIGGYELGAGAVSVGLGNSLALLDVGIGAGLVGMVLSRRTEINTYIQLGVNSYNKSDKAQ
jgi:hypothetical protein